MRAGEEDATRERTVSPYDRWRTPSERAIEPLYGALGARPVGRLRAVCRYAAMKLAYLCSSTCSVGLQSGVPTAMGSTACFHSFVLHL